MPSLSDLDQGGACSLGLASDCSRWSNIEPERCAPRAGAGPTGLRHCKHTAVLLVSNIRIIGVSEDEDKKKDHEKILEEIIVENFPKMGRK